MYQFINSLKINKLSGEFVLTRHKLETLKCMNRSYTFKRGGGEGVGVKPTLENSALLNLKSKNRPWTLHPPDPRLSSISWKKIHVNIYVT